MHDSLETFGWSALLGTREGLCHRLRVPEMRSARSSTVVAALRSPSRWCHGGGLTKQCRAGQALSMFVRRVHHALGRGVQRLCDARKGGDDPLVLCVVEQPAQRNYLVAEGVDTNADVVQLLVEIQCAHLCAPVVKRVSSFVAGLYRPVPACLRRCRCARSTMWFGRAVPSDECCRHARDLSICIDVSGQFCGTSTGGPREVSLSGAPVAGPDTA